MMQIENSPAAKPVALLLSASFVLPTVLAGCGGGGGGQTDPGTSAPPNVPPPGMNRPAMAPKQGMSKAKKTMIVLAGAAALYYVYKKHQAKSAQDKGPGKYFISKTNGRVYYRNMQTGAFQYVSPPTQPIQVPADQAQEYSGYAGYNNQNTGKVYGGYGPGQPTYNDAEPAMAQ